MSSRRTRRLSAVMGMAAVALVVLALQGLAAEQTQAVGQAGDIELSLDATGSSHFSCDPGPKPDKCEATGNFPFTLVVSVNVADVAYRSYTLGVDHPSLLSTDVRYVSPAFPECCQFPVSGIGTTAFVAGAAVTLSPPVTPTTYTGPLVEADLQCLAEGTHKISITIPPTGVRDVNNDPISITTVDQGGSKVADTLLINCVEPVGGIAGLPALTEAQPTDSVQTASSQTPLVAIIGAVVAAGVALGAMAWYATRRRTDAQ